MTTTVSTPPDGARSPEHGAVDAYRALGALLPRLAQPWWYRHAHSGRWHPPVIAPVADDPAVAKAQRRKARKAGRLARALAGQHTRSPRRGA